MCHYRHLSAASAEDFNTKQITAQSGNAVWKKSGKMLEKIISFGKILPVFPRQTELKNICGFENVANHNSARQQI